MNSLRAFPILILCIFFCSIAVSTTTTTYSELKFEGYDGANNILNMIDEVYSGDEVPDYSSTELANGLLAAIDCKYDQSASTLATCDISQENSDTIKHIAMESVEEDPDSIVVASGSDPEYSDGGASIDIAYSPQDNPLNDADGFDSDWNLELDRNWQENNLVGSQGEDLSVTGDGNSLIFDTGDDYLAGEAYLSNQYSGDNTNLIVDYRVLARKDATPFVNKFGIVSGNEESTVLLTERVNIDSVDENFDQTDKNFAVSHSLTDGENVKIGVFERSSDAPSGGTGGSGNGLKFRIDDIHLKDEDRQFTFQKNEGPDSGIQLTKDTPVQFKFTVKDNYNQLDIANVIVDHDLNGDDDGILKKKTCGAQSPSFCIISFEFEPSEYGEHEIGVGLRTKTGVERIEKYSYSVTPGGGL